MNNPQYGLCVPEGGEDAHIFLTLQQNDEEMSEVGMYIFSMDSQGGKGRRVDDNGEVLAKSKFQSPLSSSLEITVRAGRGIVILPCTFDPDMPGFFELIASSSCKVDLFEIGGENESVVSIEGEWGEKTSGGCFNHPTWRQNKQYLMYVHKPTTLQVKVSHHLSSNSSPFSIGAYVLSPSPSHPSFERLFVTPPDVLSRSPFAPLSSTVTEPFLADPSPHPYIIIPCPFHPENYSKFSLSVEDVMGGEMDGRVELKEADLWEKGMVEGEWGEGMAGGSFMHSSWRENRQYRVRVRVGGRVCLRLRRLRVCIFLILLLFSRSIYYLFIFSFIFIYLSLFIYFLMIFYLNNNNNNKK